MNELGKLFSSILLLAAGFFAASFVGPPEVVGRLARYLEPSGAADADTDGLRPLPAPTATAADQEAWPDLPRPTSATAEPAAPVEPPPGPPVTPASWPGDDGESTDDWPDTPADAPAASDDDWLTAATLAPMPSETAAPDRPLTPIPRGGAAAEPSPVDEPDWPTLQPPNRPAVEPEAPTLTEQSPPSLEESPYGKRPQRDAAPLAEWNPLRLQPAGPRLDAIERRQVGPSYADHIVTDGDTLAGVAERYLGDAGRAQELYELNRDRLDHPDVLPIGLVLRVPVEPTPRRTAAPAADGFPPLERGSSFGALAAADAQSRVTRRPVSPAERPLTPVTPGAEPVGPATPAPEPVFDHDVMWDASGW